MKKQHKFWCDENDKICRKWKKIKLQGLQDPSHNNVDNGCNTMGHTIQRSNFRINNNICLLNIQYQKHKTLVQPQ